MTQKKFLRRNTGDYSRLGRKRKKLQKWRAPKGRDNKMRLRERGYPKTVEVGYKQDGKTRFKKDGKTIVRVETLGDLRQVKKEDLVLVGKVGRKKFDEIIKLAKEKGFEVINKRKPVKKKEKKVEEKKPEPKKEEKKKEEPKKDDVKKPEDKKE